MKKITLLLTTLLLALTLAGCNQDEDDGQNVVYTTTYPLYYLLEEIGEDVIDVKYVPGSQVHGESHDWSQKEIIDMQDADYLFYVGAGFDTYITANVDSVFKDQNVELVKMEDHIDIIEVELAHHHEEEDEDHDNDNGYTEVIPDAHFWLDVSRMQEAAELVFEQLVIMYPEEDTRLENNYVHVDKLLEKLHHDFIDALTNKDKPIVTNVKLFSYFEDAYDLDLNPLNLNAHAHEDETVPNDLETFVNFVIDNDLNYILFEKNATSPAGDTLVSEVNKTEHTVEKLYVHPIGNITTEELNENQTYITLMYDNLESLENALE
ncbi:MAG: metal ABC transporter solute-binding protein, Zn/Mn family [Bacillota bacterium]